jgi:hypothetical protein
MIPWAIIYWVKNLHYLNTAFITQSFDIIHCLAQRKFSKECDLVLRLEIQYLLFYWRSSSSCLGPLPHHPVTAFLPSFFLPATCVRRQILREMWPIQLAFLLFIVRRIFLSSLTLRDTSSVFTRSVRLISIALQHYISKLSGCFWSNVYVVQLDTQCSFMVEFIHNIYRLYSVSYLIGPSSGAAACTDWYVLKNFCFKRQVFKHIPIRACSFERRSWGWTYDVRNTE